jgi:hypothetical protein
MRRLTKKQPQQRPFLPTKKVTGGVHPYKGSACLITGLLEITVAAVVATTAKSLLGKIRRRPTVL